MNGLPYFKFMVGEWLSGDIQICTPATKGIFVDLCAQLWKRGGYLPDDNEYIARLLKVDLHTFSIARVELEQWSIIATTNDKQCYVDFIIEQHEELDSAHAKRVTAGRKGGNAKQLKRRSNATAILKQCSSNAVASKNQSQSQSQNPPPTPRGGDDSDFRQQHPHYAALVARRELAGLTPEMWLRCRKNRSPHMNWDRAVQYVIGKVDLTANDLEGITAPGRFVDYHLGAYEKDNLTQIRQNEERAKEREKRIKELAEFIVDPPVREGAVDDAKADLAREYGKGAVEEATKLAGMSAAKGADTDE